MHDKKLISRLLIIICVLVHRWDLAKAGVPLCGVLLFSVIVAVAIIIAVSATVESAAFLLAISSVGLALIYFVLWASYKLKVAMQAM